jgi:hypothetical protein
MVVAESLNDKNCMSISYCVKVIVRFLPSDVVENFVISGLIQESAQEAPGVGLDDGLEAGEGSLGTKCVREQTTVLLELGTIIRQHSCVPPADHITQERHQRTIRVDRSLALHHVSRNVDAVHHHHGDAANAEVDDITYKAR